MAVAKRVATQTSKPTLWYFDFPGLGEAARLTFVLGDVAFNDRRVNKAHWDPAWKSLFPSGRLPCLEVDGVQYSESRAILMYAANKAGLVPEDPEQALQAQSLMAMVYDVVFKAWRKARAAANVTGSFDLADLENKLKALDEMVAATQDESGHCVGGRLTYIDALVGSLLQMKKMMHGPEFFEKLTAMNPHIALCQQMVYAHPLMQEYVTKNYAPRELTFVKGCWRGCVLSTMLRMAEVKFEVEELPEEEAAGNRLLPVLSLGQNTTISGLHAIITWISSNKLFLLVCSPEATCRIWGIVDMVGTLWETVVAGVESEEAVLRQLNIVNAAVIRERGVAGTFNPRRFTVADVVLGSFYEFMVTHQLKYKQLPVNSLTGFKQSYTVMSQAPTYPLAGWVNNPVVPELYYYNFPTRVEAARLAFHIGGMKFKDIRFDQETKSQYAHLSPTSKWPVMKMGDKIYCESLAILKLVAEWTDLMPSTIHGRTVADIVASVYDEMEGVVQKGYKIGHDKMVEVLKEGTPPVLDKTEAVLEFYRVSDTYIVDHRLTWIDLWLAANLNGLYFVNCVTADEKRWPCLTKVHSVVYEHPSVKKYVESLGPYMAH